MIRMVKNLKILVAVVGVMFFALALRLAYIQLIGGEELSAATRMQSLIALEGSNTRGIIYDRNGVPLVADERNYIYIIKENEFDADAQNVLDALDADVVSGENEGYYVYSSEKYDKRLGGRLIRENDAYIVQASARYSEEQSAEHLVGYINDYDKSGAAGLELMYDKELSGLNRQVYAVADVAGNILPGRGLVLTSDDKKDSSVKSGIRTTIDKELQRAVEDIIEDEEKNCAVAVLDCSSGGVTAMACTPGFDPADVDVYLQGDGDELLNKVTQGEYAPGSIFKIVVAAAALENSVPADKSFNCDGASEVGNLVIGCETGGSSGHGSIDFESAFADSCNSFFIQLGQEIGAEKILETAEKFGLGKAVLDGYPHEGSGHLMTSGESSGDAIGNLSIGQGENLVTPLQVAAMTNIIANGGVDKGVHLLASEEADDERVVSERTAEIIGLMMEAVSMEGTASGLELGSGEFGKGEPGEGESSAGKSAADGFALGKSAADGFGVGANPRPAAAVKTGTAEYGEDGAGGARTHAWITGFTPCEEPEYTITVFVEDGVSGSGSAGPVLEKIIRYLEKSGSYSRPTLA